MLIKERIYRYIGSLFLICKERMENETDFGYGCG